MKKRFGLWIVLAMMAALIGGCGEPAETADTREEETSPSSETTSQESGVSETEPVSVPDGEPAGDQPVGDFWSIPDDQPLDTLMEDYPDVDFQLIPSLRPEDAGGFETVGQWRDYWASLSPDDPRLDHFLTLTPEEKELQLEHENPLLAAVGDRVEGTVEKGKKPAAFTLTGVQSDGYVTYLDMEYSGPEEQEFNLTQDRSSSSPNSSHGAYGSSGFYELQPDTTYEYMFYASLPYSQLARQADAPFAFDIDISLTDYQVERRSAVFPRADNTKEGLAPLSAQVSPLSFAVTFAMMDMPTPTDVSEMQPVKLLNGSEVVYTLDGTKDENFWYTLMPVSMTYVPVVEETATIAGEYDWRPVATLLVCGQEEEREIFPDFDQIDAIKFEGIVYPMQ